MNERAPPAMRTLAMVALVLAAVALVVRYTVPVADGDIFFHLAYAEQMLERGTLVPDHTIYSWTPASNATLYCAWLAQLALYGLWRLGGLEALFALRYALALASVGLMWQFARAAGLRLSLPVVAVIVVSAFGSAPVAVNLKPEMLSVFFTHVTLWAWFHAKRADRGGAPAWRWLMLVPAVMLPWVNSHGGFTLIAPLLAALLAGEWLNRALGQRAALSAANQRALVAAWALAALAVCLTPYGTAYPRQLFIDNVLHNTVPAGAYAWHAASQSVLSSFGSPHMLLELFGVMGLVLVVLMLAPLWPRPRPLPPEPRAGGGDAGRGGRRDIDCALVLMLAAAAALFFWFLRTTYLLPVAFGYAALHLLATNAQARTVAGSSRALGALALGLVAAVALRATEGTLHPRSRGDFFGLGINHEQPVDETEFVAAHALPRDLYNVFDSGSYLLWRLYPRHRVMVDSRAFPYYGWFADQEAFTHGERFETFLAKYPADAAVIDLEKAPVWRRFVRERDWQPLFYGATAAVFVRRTASPDLAAPLQAAERLRVLRNARAGERVFAFATHVGDYATAWQVLAQLEGPLGARLDAQTLTRMRDYRFAHAALLAGRHDEALPALEQALAGVVASERERTLLRLLRAAAVPGRGAEEMGTLRAGIERLLAAPPR
ncbi:MAG: hypothetical protein HZC37_20115 [Burkholderiales bacterium]|nr:hypothetical protein [Burkholderiales bacterium]